MTAPFAPLNPPSRVLMGPGPSDVAPSISSAMAKPTLGHLDPRFLEVMDQIRSMMRSVYKTENELTFPMSGTGSAGMETCFVNLLEPGLSRLPWLFRMARWARANARANLAWAVGYNAIGMTLAAQGRLTPVFAAAIMVTSSIAVVLQAQRSAPSFEESAREARGAGPAQGEGSFSSQETARWSEGSPPTVRSSTVSQLDGANT